ncbi:hypothetical protein D3C77_293920 [compost metagenome]
MYQPVFQPVLAVCQQLGGQGRVGRLVPGTANGARQCFGEEVALLPAIEALGGAGDEALLGGELEAEVEALLGVTGPLGQQGPGAEGGNALLAFEQALPRQHHLGGVGLKGGVRHPLYQGLPLGRARDIPALPRPFLQ